MKIKTSLITLLAMMAISTLSFAQASLKEDVDYIQREWGMKKMEVVKSYMDVKEPQATEFWKLYDAYEIERKALGKTRLMLLNDYATHVESLTPEKADEIAKATLKNNEAYQKLYTKYYKKAKKILGAIAAAKFIQAENALQTAINHETQLAIPFIGQLEKEKKN
jgi:hypothetical protein